MHHRDLVADLRRHAKVMGDEQHRQVQARTDVVQQFQHLLLHRHIECGHGFVCDQHLGFHGQSAGDTDALALTAGEFVWEPLQRLWIQTHQFHELAGPTQSVVT